MIAAATAQDLTFRQKREIVNKMRETALKNKILSIIGNYFNVDLKSKSRKREVVFPKMVAAHCLYVFTEMSYPKISYELWSCHGTAHSTLTRLRGLMKYDENIRKQVIKVESLIEEIW